MIACDYCMQLTARIGPGICKIYDIEYVTYAHHAHAIFQGLLSAIKNIQI